MLVEYTIINICQVYFWTTIRKNRAKYNLTRGFSEDDITKILLHEVICRKDAMSAESQLLKLSGIRKFIDRLKTEREREDFRKHMRKYINMWLPDCPFEVSTTNRYTIVTHEAAVVARRDIRKGETIKYLCGNLVAITPDEELDLDLTRRDFSIVMSSRKKTPSIFLGPARFANHDCNANARLVTVGPDGMEVVAVRHIEQDEEITVTYGDDYFGHKNCECLCGTCELNQRNGWTPLSNPGPSRIATPQILEEQAGPYSFRRKRKFGGSGLASPSLLSDAEEGRSPKRSRSTLSSSGASTPVKRPTRRSIISEMPLAKTVTKENDFLSNGVDDIAIATQVSKSMITEATNNPITTAIDNGEDLLPETKCEEVPVLAFTAEERPIVQRARSVPLPTTSSHHEAFAYGPLVTVSDCEARLNPITATPDSSGTTGVLVESTQSSIEPSDTDSIFGVDLIKTSTPPSTPDTSRYKDLYLSTRGLDLPERSSNCHSDAETRFSKIGTSTPEDVQATVEISASPDDTLHESDSELSCLSSNEVFDDINFCIVHKPKSKARTKKGSKLETNMKSDIEMPLKRHAGDYLRTSLLLGEPYSRWVDCSTCNKSWVQQNGYYTRRECPRCERHSKLYGYQWPKTERGKGDKERVMDHRTVHRFLYPEEEASIKKRSRGLLRPDFSGALPSPPSSQP